MFENKHMLKTCSKARLTYGEKDMLIICLTYVNRNICAILVSVHVKDYIHIEEFCPKLFNLKKKIKGDFHFALLLNVYSCGDVFNQTELISVFHSTLCSNYSCYLFYSLH